MEELKWTTFQRGNVNHLPDSLTSFSIGKGVIYLNSRYQVIIKKPSKNYIWLSIKSVENTRVTSWRDLQRIKNELIGVDYEAVQLFPAEDRLVDTANQYHLYVITDDDGGPVKLPFGFNDRIVSELEYNGSKQHPFEEDERPKDCGKFDDFYRKTSDSLFKKK